MGDKQSKPQVVIAIDFGTSYTGYAYSYVKNREKTNLNENWGAELGAQFYKTPTAVLYSKGKEKFQSFGFEAENDYYHEIETCTEKQIKPGLYRFFKMQLHEKKVCTSSLLFFFYLSSSTHLLVLFLAINFTITIEIISISG